MGRGEGRSRGRPSIVSTLVVLIAVANAASAAPPPVEDYTKHEFIGDIALSPAGTRLAVAAPGPNGRVQLAVMELDPLSAPKPIASVANADVFDVYWVNDERLVFHAYDSTAAADFAYEGLFAVDRDGRDLRQLIAPIYAPDETRSSIAARMLNWEWSFYGTVDDGTSDVFVVRRLYDAKRDLRDLVLSRLNTRTGAVSSLSYGAPEGARVWIVDDKGDPRFVETSRDDRRRIYLRADGDKAWKQVGDFAQYTNEGFDPWYVDAGGSAYVLGSLGRDLQALYRLDPGTGRVEAEPLITLRGFDLDPSAEVDRPARKLLGLHFRGDHPGTYWFDTNLRKLQQGIDAALPGERINRLYCGRCTTTRYIVVKSSSDRQPGEFFLFDRKELKLQRIGFARPWLDEKVQGRRTLHRVAARDGLSLPVYVTRPAGARDGEALPAVVLVHGGPFVRGHDLQWSPRAQFLASRGYTVLEVEYRGSTGYGFKHFRAGWKQWGRAMQDDLADAVAWSAKQNLVDPKQVCIVGASYGGYAALMGPIRSPGVYRCAASFAGVSDINLMSDLVLSDLPEAWKRYGIPQLIGDPKNDRAQLEAASPLKQAAKINVPVLLVHGRLDRRVPIDHSLEFLGEARRAGVKIEWVEYSDEAHGFVNPANHADFLRRLETFLARSLGRETRQ